MKYRRPLGRQLIRFNSLGGTFACLLVLTEAIFGLTPVMGADVFVSEPVVPGEFYGDVRDLPPPELSPSGEFAPRVAPPPLDPDPEGKLLEWPESPIDPLMETLWGLERTYNPPDLNFQGIPFQGGAPPDTVGEIGANHYIQMTNASVVQIYNKSGVLLAGPFALNSLAPAGNACQNGIGDPIVLYDELANRWVLTEFLRAAVGGVNGLCVYVSMTNDPVAGGWFVYAYTTTNLPDYPKYAVWPDAYYVSANEGGAVYALNRTQMLAGTAGTYQRFTAPLLAGFGFQALTPSDLDGSVPPVAGTPNFFMRHRDDEVHNAGTNNPTQDFLEIWAFSVDFTTPANSTFTQIANIAVAEFDSTLCGLTSFFCFPQPGTTQTLDPLREVIMWRLQYRNFGSHETLVGNFVTDVTGTDQGGIRWFELRRTPPGTGAWSLFQEGTHSPDTDNRWMGSIAMDRAGNIALGYSVSSATTFPSIRYTGRASTDTLGTMSLGEVTAVAGAFSQTGVDRWGDYSSMNVDPVDGCTFWYTNEFVGDNQPNGFGNGRWTTQIVRFDLPPCLNQPDKIGVYRPSARRFYLDVNGNGVWNGTPTDATYVFGISNDVSLSGDWNGDGFSQIGIYRPSTRQFYLDMNGNGVWDGIPTDATYVFGIVGDQPIIGNWNGVTGDEIGVYRPSARRFYLDVNGNGVWNGTPTDATYVFGIVGDQPIIGNWNGVTGDEIGVYRPSARRFYLDVNGNGVWNGTPTDATYVFGITNDVPIIGNWNGVIGDEIGIYRPSSRQFYLDVNGNGVWNGTPTDATYVFGIANDVPLIGRW